MRNDTMTSYFAGNRKKGDRTSVLVTSARKIEDYLGEHSEVNEPLTFTCVEEGSLSIFVSDAWKTAEAKWTGVAPYPLDYKGFNLTYRVNNGPFVNINFRNGGWTGYAPHYPMYEELKVGDKVTFYGQNPYGVGVECWQPYFDFFEGTTNPSVPEGKDSYEHFKFTSGIEENTGSTPGSGKFEVSGNFLSIIDWEGVKKNAKAEYETISQVKMAPVNGGAEITAGVYAPSFAWLFHTNNVDHKICLTGTGGVFVPRNFTGVYALAGVHFEQKELVDYPKGSVAKIGFRMMESNAEGCEKLTHTDEIRSAVCAHGGCYRMFKNCKSLAHTSTITFQDFKGSTQGGWNCAEMFMGCESLTMAPVLRGEEILEYTGFSMFEGCKNLSITNEILVRKVKNNSCERMFYGCEKLANLSIANYLYKTSAVPTDAFKDWMAGNKVTHGVFIAAPNSEWPTENHGASGNPWPIVGYQIDANATVDQPTPKVIHAASTLTIGNPQTTRAEIAVRIKGTDNTAWRFNPAIFSEEGKLIGDTTSIEGYYTTNEKTANVWEVCLVIDRKPDNLDPTTWNKTDIKEINI